MSPPRHALRLRALPLGLAILAPSVLLTGCFSAPPQIVELSPPAGSTQLDANAIVEVVFDQPVTHASVAAHLNLYETLPPNEICTVTGTAWAGETEVTEISVSTDGGESWREAEFVDPPERYAWRRWRLDWLTPKTPGKYVLLARAKDARGGVQPDGHDPRYGTYVIHHPLPIEVFVRADERKEEG